MPAALHEAGTWSAKGGRLFAADPLTLWQTKGPGLPVPEAPARLVGLLEPEQGRTALMALIWSDAPVACGADLATIGVDAGLAAFLSPQDAAALEIYSDTSMGGYHGTLAEQLDRHIPTKPFVARIPNATFPVTGSGWGDGGYPVASLVDASGQMVALYTQFITAEGQDWLLPQPCGDETS